MSDILFVLWFFLPSGVANVAPIFASHMSFLKPYSFPLDFHRTFGGKRVFGSHKTIRGLITGILAAVFIVAVEKYIYEQTAFVASFVPINYSAIDPIIFGTLSALGAILADAAKSFFKRQLDIAEGKTWFPFDQVDYILGGIIFTSFYIPLSVSQYLLLFVVWFLIHIISTITGFLLKLKTTPI